MICPTPHNGCSGGYRIRIATRFGLSLRSLLERFDRWKQVLLVRKGRSKEVADLSKTHTDPLARAVRRILRERHDVDTSKHVGIKCVFSTESRHEPQPLSYDGTEGFKCICPTKGNNLHGCETRNLIEGTTSFVTGSFGLVAASVVVRDLTGK